MLIKNIPFVKVRERAYANRDRNSEDLDEAFAWRRSPEDFDFWDAVHLENWETAKSIRPELFAPTLEEEEEAYAMDNARTLYFLPLDSQRFREVAAKAAAALFKITDTKRNVGASTPGDFVAKEPEITSGATLEEEIDAYEMDLRRDMAYRLEFRAFQTMLHGSFTACGATPEEELQPQLLAEYRPVDYRAILKEVLANNDVSRLKLSEAAQLELQKIAEEIVIESANT